MYLEKKETQAQPPRRSSFWIGPVHHHSAASDSDTSAATRMKIGA